jgi:hypothetical protein
MPSFKKQPFFVKLQESLFKSPQPGEPESRAKTIFVLYWPLSAQRNWLPGLSKKSCRAQQLTSQIYQQYLLPYISQL